MPPKAVSAVTQVSDLFLRTGFLQTCLKYDKTSITYGPAGFLLRKNIEDVWWQRMVTKTETCFPMVGRENEPHLAYQNILGFVNNSLPFSIAHISQNETVKNSIIPKVLLPLIDQSILTNLQMTHFCTPSALHQTFDQIIDTRLKWWKQYCGNSSRFSKEDEGNSDGYPSFYLKYEFPWGTETIEKIGKMGEKMALDIQEKTQKSCSINTNGGEAILPHCIVTTMSLDTAVMVYLDDGRLEKPNPSVPHLPRQTLQLHPALAPFKVAVTQHGSRERQLNEVSQYISRTLRTAGIHTLYSRDTKTPIAKQIFRHDGIGVPFTVIVTDQTLQNGAIQLRNRDTTIHETMAINKLEEYVLQHLNFQG